MPTATNTKMYERYSTQVDQRRAAGQHQRAGEGEDEQRRDDHGACGEPAQLLARLAPGDAQPLEDRDRAQHDGHADQHVAREHERRCHPAELGILPGGELTRRDGQDRGPLQDQCRDRDRRREPPAPVQHTPVGHQQEHQGEERQDVDQVEQLPQRDKAGRNRAGFAGGRDVVDRGVREDSQGAAQLTDREQPADGVAGIPRDDQRADRRAEDRADGDERKAEIDQDVDGPERHVGRDDQDRLRRAQARRSARTGPSRRDAPSRAPAVGRREHGREHGRREYGNRENQTGAGPRRRRDVQGSVRRVDPIAKVLQPPPSDEPRPRGIETHAIVDDLRLDPTDPIAVAAGQRPDVHRDLRCRGVLRRVLQCLETAEVERGLDVEPAGGAARAR